MVLPEVKGLGYLHEFLLFWRTGGGCQSAEGDFWTGGLSRWWMSLLTGRPFSMARFAQLESEQSKPTDWPNTNAPFRSASDLLTLVHKDLAEVMRTKGLKEDASSNWAGFRDTKDENKGTNCISPLFFVLLSLTLPLALFPGLALYKWQLCKVELLFF